MRYNSAVVRVWCLAAFVCLSLLGAANRTTHDVLNGQPPDGGSVLTEAPPDGPVDRHWEAVRPAACPSGSSWTSPTHHAVLAHTLCHRVAGVLRSDDVAVIPTPRALRLQFRTPLLI